ncbi:MAG TPA: ABC transporter permease [Candidatus Deferrimicrobium sp.]|nr:ABC transporter permease [Candidatus Deferrimicrobium sp.]
MSIVKLVGKNAFRHPLRTSLTISGLAIAVMAFIVIRTTVDAWYAGAEASSPNRLVTRSSVSIIFTLPLSYREQIAKIDGVTGISYGQWFGGIYVDPKNFFAQFAVDHATMFDLYPEYVVPPDQMEVYLKERNAVIVGRKLADRFGWSVGDAVRLTGTIYPGDWDFVIRGIYTGAKPTTDESGWYFRHDYLDERMRVEAPPRAGQVGWFIVRIADPSRAAAISQQIDKFFENSLAETLTETEEAFNLSFIAMGSAIIFGLNAISLLVVAIILLVLGNTMAMTARERVSEYAVMKTLGFGSWHIIGLIFGESLFIAAVGGAAGVALAFPVAKLVGLAVSNYFPVFKVEPVTYFLAVSAAGLVGLLAAVFPTGKALHTPIVKGLRIID